MSVLIVEDDAGVQESIAELLRDEGYDVEVASDGKDALERLHAGKIPELILLDLMMSGMDGVEFRSRQLSDERIAGIPVVVISAKPDLAAQARRLQANDFLAKPMSFEELLYVVQNRAITVVGVEDLAVTAKTLHEAWSTVQGIKRGEEDPH
jgi:CheY-like chemotaxis protein